jgi:hypothetical protein
VLQKSWRWQGLSKREQKTSESSCRKEGYLSNISRPCCAQNIRRQKGNRPHRESWAKSINDGFQNKRENKRM